MSSWALLGGLMGGAQAAQTLLLNRANQMQKDKDKADEQALWTKRQYLMESLKAPAEKTVEQDDPNKPGWKQKVTSQWQPPTQDGQRGSYVEVGRQAVPPKFTKDKISLPGNQEQDVLLDESGNVKPLGAARDIFDPSSKARLGIEGANLSVAQQRLAMEQGNNSFNQSIKVKELADKQAAALDAKNNPNHERYSFHEQDDPTTPSGKAGYKFDKFTGDFNPTHASNGLTPGGGLVAQMGQQQPSDPGDFAPTPSPLSQLSPSSAKGAAGPFPAAANTQQQGGAHGAVVRTGTNKQGQKVAQYADGTILPVP